MLRREEPQLVHEEMGFPRWIPVLFGFIVLVGVVVAIVQRQTNDRPMTVPLIAAGLILSPFFLEVVQLVIPYRVGLSRHVFPLPVLMGTALLVFAPTPVDFAPFTLVFLAAEMAGISERSRWFGIAVALAGIGIMVVADIWGPYNESFIWVIGISFGWFGGFLVQSLAQRTIELRKANEELGETAAAHERQRIAREIHDVIAHSMSVTMLHVTAARMALEKGEGASADALEALREAEEQGRRSLAEIRTTVGLLGTTSSERAAMPGIDDLPKLVEDFRSAGLDVSLRVEGDVASLPPAAALNLYRITQESLSNVAKHAPGAAAEVVLTLDDREVALRVHNASSNGSVGPSDGNGIGLRGMAERAALIDGDLTAGPDADGWTVSVRAPTRKST